MEVFYATYKSRIDSAAACISSIRVRKAEGLYDWLWLAHIC